MKTTAHDRVFSGYAVGALMTPTWRVMLGDVRERLRELPEASVQCCVTSPPYWGLRDYGHDGQIGLERTPEDYVDALVGVFAEVWRVLRADGVVWLNLGDSYVANGSNQVPQSKQHVGSGFAGPNRNGLTGLAAKNLVGVPWRVAFALQAAGWYLRSEIIWHKPNPMPESVTDRPTKAHEYMFLLSKSERYYYDADAIREEYAEDSLARVTRGRSQIHKYSDGGPGDQTLARDITNACTSLIGRNKRSVWTVATQPYPEAHFATFPEALIEPCILAGTSEKGQCPQCGAPWVRVVERESMEVTPTPKRAAWQSNDDHARTQIGGTMTKPPRSTTVGWQRSCTCDAGDTVPQTVLDPFTGSGTTGTVSVRHQRSFIGIELNPTYLELARTRIGAVAPLFAEEVA